MRTLAAYTFTKYERLCSKSIIDTLFEKGNRTYARFPFRFLYVSAPVEGPYPVQVLITVSRKNFPKSTQRNKIKRQLRELYRTHKHILYQALEGKPQRFALMVAYQSKENMPYSKILPVFKQCIQFVADDMAKTHSAPLSGTDQIV